MLALGSGYEDLANLLWCLTEGAVIAEHDVVALAALDALGKLHAAEGGLDDGLEDAKVDILAGKFAADGFNLQIFAAGDAVRKGGAGAVDLLDGGFDLKRDAFDFFQVIAGDFDADGGSDAG